MQQFELILKSEMLFAREVALGLVVTRPLKSWTYLIPGMFIIDFLRRQKAIRQFSQEYMYPRKHALYCAKALMEGLSKEQMDARTETCVAQWPNPNLKNAEASRDLQLSVIELLIPHYQKLLAAEGGSFTELLASAYPNRSGLQQLMNRLNRLEMDRDHALPEENMSGRWNHQFDAIHTQVEMRRSRLIDEVY